jgi:hypothetical protein
MRPIVIRDVGLGDNFYSQLLHLRAAAEAPLPETP